MVFITKVCFILILGFFTMALANCGSSSAPQSDESASISAKERTIGETSKYSKIVYDPALEGEASVPASPFHIEIDLELGTFVMNDESGDYSCAMDGDTRLGELRSLMAVSSVCEPGTPPPDTMICMALGLADIKLSNSQTHIELRPTICHHGTFLCDGNDSVLRALLSDLQAHVPIGCVAN